MDPLWLVAVTWRTSWLTAVVWRIPPLAGSNAEDPWAGSNAEDPWAGSFGAADSQAGSCDEGSPWWSVVAATWTVWHRGSALTGWLGDCLVDPWVCSYPEQTVAPRVMVASDTLTQDPQWANRSRLMMHSWQIWVRLNSCTSSGVSSSGFLTLMPAFSPVTVISWGLKW